MLRCCSRDAKRGQMCTTVSCSAANLCKCRHRCGFFWLILTSPVLLFWFHITFPHFFFFALAQCDWTWVQKQKKTTTTPTSLVFNYAKTLFVPCVPHNLYSLDSMERILLLCVLSTGQDSFSDLSLLSLVPPPFSSTGLISPPFPRPQRGNPILLIKHGAQGRRLRCNL